MKAVDLPYLLLTGAAELELEKGTEISLRCMRGPSIDLIHSI